MRVAKWVGLVSLGLIVLLFALIGALYTFRGTPVSAVRSLGDGGQQTPMTDSVHRAAVALLSGVPMSEGNEVQVLLNGEQTFPRLWSDLRSARESITLRLYYILPGSVADTLHGILAERARAGVQVLYLYDAFGSEFEDGHLESLEAAGVRVAAFRPVKWYTLNRAQNRSHVRAIVIDGRVGYTGGLGIDDHWLGGGRRANEWRETDVRFEGPSVSTLQAAFMVGWAEATGALLAGPLFFPWQGPGSGGRVAGLLYTAPTSGSTAAERFLALTISSATRTLYIANPYFVPDDDMRGLLIAARRRGVDVRVLTVSRDTDMPVARLAGRRVYEELLEGGVRIYEYQPTMMHAKTIAVDGVWSTIGTMNFDNRSAALNDESNLVIFDPEIGRQLTEVFQADLRLARELRLETFRRRPWYDRILERGASTLTRLL